MTEGATIGLGNSSVPPGTGLSTADSCIMTDRKVHGGRAQSTCQRGLLYEQPRLVKGTRPPTAVPLERFSLGGALAAAD
eukprot:COSAG01_NODE_1029_length_12019_cov_560.144631_17_plen_79_part_00